MEGTTNAELLGALKELLTELQERLANYAEAAADSPDAGDEGLVLAVKVDKIVQAARFGFWCEPPSFFDSQNTLEKAAAANA